MISRQILRSVSLVSLSAMAASTGLRGAALTVGMSRLPWPVARPTAVALWTREQRALTTAVAGTVRASGASTAAAEHPRNYISGSVPGALITAAAAAAASRCGGLVRRRAASSTAAASSASDAEGLDFRSGMGEAAAQQVGQDMEVILVPCLNDNYAPVFHDKATGATAVVDSPEVAPILAAIEQRGWKLTHILNTHHHHDHTGGNEELVERTGCKVIGPAGEANRIPGIQVAVAEGDRVEVGSLEATVLEVGGHTLGHIAYHFPAQNVAFVGDTLFVLGCGRIFEGTPSQMLTSLQKLRNLPDETVIYCAHEYTASNARFAEHVGGVPRLSERVAVIKELRSAGKATVPTILGHEKATNAFLRADSDELRTAAGLPKGAVPVQVFAEVRKQKDHF